MDCETVYQEAMDSFTLGNYQDCLKQLHSIRTLPAELRQKVDLLTFRSYIAQKKFNVVINELSDSVEFLDFKLVLLLAKIKSGVLSGKEVEENLASLLCANLNANDDTCLLLAATIYTHLGMPEKALKVLHQGSDLYCDAMAVHCFITMNRFDLAGKAVRRLQVADEDALASQLASAAFFLTQGGDKLTEALHIYQELQEKYKPSPLLLNGQAAALMSLGRWSDAEPVLQQSLDLEPSHAETLINMLVVSQHTGKSIETINRFISQLRDCDKNHPFLSSIDHMDEVFLDASKPFTPSVVG